MNNEITNWAKESELRFKEAGLSIGLYDCTDFPEELAENEVEANCSCWAEDDCDDICDSILFDLPQGWAIACGGTEKAQKVEENGAPSRWDWRLRSREIRMSKKSLSSIRKAASKRGLARRWGDSPRTPSAQIRVDADAAAALATVPDRDRRQLASDAIRSAVAAYNQDHA